MEVLKLLKFPKKESNNGSLISKADKLFNFNHMTKKKLIFNVILSDQVNCENYLIIKHIGLKIIKMLLIEYLWECLSLKLFIEVLVGNK